MSNTPLPEPAFGFLVVSEETGQWIGSRAGEAAFDADNLHAHAAAVTAAKDARIKVLEDALAEVLEFQSAPTQPTIHDWGRWRRALHAHAAAVTAAKDARIKVLEDALKSFTKSTYIRHQHPRRFAAAVAALGDSTSTTQPPSPSPRS